MLRDLSENLVHEGMTVVEVRALLGPPDQEGKGVVGKSRELAYYAGPDPHDSRCLVFVARFDAAGRLEYWTGPGLSVYPFPG